MSEASSIMASRVSSLPGGPLHDSTRSSQEHLAFSRCSMFLATPLRLSGNVKQAYESVPLTARAAMVADTKPAKTDRFDRKPRINGNSSKLISKSTYSAPSPVEVSSGKGGEESELVSVQDYLEQSVELCKPDNGPPRWFCPLSCGKPTVPDAPLLLFLPGIDGTGLGLILHHRTLGPLFEVRCLHVPVHDRTPFQGLLEIVESTVRAESKSRPTRPIYLVGDSFGGCLALAIASRNPTIDLVLVLANPGTSIAKSPLQPVFPLLDLIPDDLFQYVPYLFSFTMGDPVRMASAGIPKTVQEQPIERSQKLAEALTGMLPALPVLAKILPRSTLTWKLKLLRAGAMYANSRLHAVKADVLVLASAKDQLLPSADEAQRLKRLLPKCEVLIFKDSGHTLLLEDGFRLSTTIKSVLFYRRSKHRDFVSDFISPTEEEFQEHYESSRTLRQIVSPVFLSTDEDGRVVKSLSAVSNDRPLLFVGNHMLMGLELAMIVEQIYKERKLLVRGLAHPTLFDEKLKSRFSDRRFLDDISLFGGTPVSGKNFYKLLASKQSVLLYPGGAREALHKKGEEYRLFWPEQSEFVRMAARFGATIVPFSCVGEDDIVQLLMDVDDLNNSFLKDVLVYAPESDLRPKSAGEVANQPLYVPILAPKVPGRFYFLFGKAIPTAGRCSELQDRKKANALYLKVKTEVESGITYLLKKRTEDPYREALPRLIYEASWGGSRQGPTFDP